MLKPFKEVEKLNISDKEAYYHDLNDYCRKIQCRNRAHIFEQIMLLIAPFLRKFKYEIRGEENVPQDSEVIFLCNHSNSHDLFMVKEVDKKLKRRGTTLVAWDGLNVFSRFLFWCGNVSFIKRYDSESIEKGTFQWCSKILQGRSGWIFGEATWNLHPIRPMQEVKAGAVRAALITKKPIVPVIFEYVEVPRTCKKEKELYSKCIVHFGESFEPEIDKNIFEQTRTIQAKMENMRRDLWNELGIMKDSLDDVNSDIYINHLYIKKFKAVGFQYVSEDESRFLLQHENEFIIDSNGNFVPGTLEKHQ